MLQVFLEEDSYNTFENIEKVAQIIRHQQLRVRRFLPAIYDHCRVTIFCEATRSATVIMLARHFMSGLINSIDDITVETASWERADPFKQAINLVYYKLAIKYPWLGLAERERRKRLKRAEQI